MAIALDRLLSKSLGSEYLFGGGALLGDLLKSIFSPYPKAADLDENMLGKS
jgi:hypothetical protein